MSRLLSVLLCLGAACATAGGPQGQGEQGTSERGDAGPGDDETSKAADAARVSDAASLSSPADAAGGGPDAAPAGCASPVWTNLLVNGDFDGAGSAWSQSTLAGVSILGSDGTVVTPHSAPGYAWFGGYHDAVDKIAQTVAVPAGAAALRLTGYYCIETEETGAFDTMTLDLTSGATVLETIATASSEGGPATCASIAFEFELAAASAHAGSSVTLALEAHTDGSLITNFFFDSLALEALACP